MRAATTNPEHAVMAATTRMAASMVTTSATTPTHGADDAEAPVGYARSLVEAARVARDGVDLQVVDGDHHLAIRRPEVVAEAIGDLLETSRD